MYIIRNQKNGFFYNGIDIEHLYCNFDPLNAEIIEDAEEAIEILELAKGDYPHLAKDIIIIDLSDKLPIIN